MPKINHDQLFKELLTTFFVEFIELFFPEVLEYLDLDSITFVDKEIFTDLTKGQKKILDVIALTKFQGQDYSFLVHIENQSSNQTDFNQRMFRYFCSLFLKYNRPIYPIAVFSYDFPKRLEKDNFTLDFPHYKVLDFNYKVVQLNQLNWRDFLTQKNPVAAALIAKMNIAKRDRPKVKAECLRLMVTLKLNPAKSQLISGFIDTYLRLNPTEKQIFQAQLNKMELEQREQIMQITTSWKEEGIKQGQVATILRLLNRKLGQIPEQITTKIESLGTTQLDSLTEELLNFQTIDDLISWLNTVR